MKQIDVIDAAAIVRSGGVVAYPTESCYGLGCNPGYVGAVQRILRMKRRPVNKGLILIADHVARFNRFTGRLPDEIMEKLLPSWPGPNTWIVPCLARVPVCLRGDHRSIAIRVTAHRGARELCARAGSALVSTSANRAGWPALVSSRQVMREFGAQLDGVVVGRIGRDRSPSTIRDAITGDILRK